MKRRQFLQVSCVAAAAALLPQVARAQTRPRVFPLWRKNGEWDDFHHSPWEGLKVSVFDHTGRRLSSSYYVDENRKVVRMVDPLESAYRLDKGECFLMAREIPPEFQEPIQERLTWVKERYDNGAYQRWVNDTPPGVGAIGPIRPPLVIEEIAAKVEVRGSPEALDRWAHDIPSSFTKVVGYIWKPKPLRGGITIHQTALHEMDHGMTWKQKRQAGMIRNFVEAYGT